MTTPPDIIGHDLLPNPGDDDERRSKKEEERRQQAIIEQIFREAKKLGIEVHTTGEIDPTAEPNPGRAEKIKNETQPKLLEYTRSFSRTIEADEIRTADGLFYKRFRDRKEAVTKLSMNLSDLVKLGHRIVDIIGDTPAAVVKIGARIWTALGAMAGGDGKPDKHEEFDPPSGGG